MAQTVKNLPAMWETWVQSLGQEGPLEKGMATHSSILAWRIPWTEEPNIVQSMGSQRGTAEQLTLSLFTGMVNSVCQLDWATRYPDIQDNSLTPDLLTSSLKPFPLESEESVSCSVLSDSLQPHGL